MGSAEVHAQLAWRAEGHASVSVAVVAMAAYNKADVVLRHI